MAAADLLVRELDLIGKTKSFDLVQAVTEPPRLVRTIDGASTLEVVVSDHRRRLLRSGMFDERSWAKVDGLNLELVAVSKAGDRLTLTFEDAIVAKLRRQRDTLSIPASSTTRAEIVARLAKEAQVEADIDPAKRGVVNSVVERSARGEEKSDSWTLLGELAEQIRWRRFSTGRQLVVGGDEWLMSRGPAGWTVREHTGPVQHVDFDLDAGKRSVEASFEVDARRWSVWPGQTVTMADMGPADDVWLVREFSRSLTSSRGLVSVIRQQKVLPEPPPPKDPSDGEPGEDGFVPRSDGDTGGRAATEAREHMVQVALAQQGKPYVLGTQGPSSFDCSGLVQYATSAAGKPLWAPSASQAAAIANAGGSMSVSDGIRTRGALLYRSGSPYNHIAISLGNGSTMEAMGSAYGCLVAGGAESRGWTFAGLWI
jgi:hypothetical protein